LTSTTSSICVLLRACTMRSSVLHHNIYSRYLTRDIVVDLVYLHCSNCL